MLAALLMCPWARLWIITGCRALSLTSCPSCKDKRELPSGTNKGWKLNLNTWLWVMCRLVYRSTLCALIINEYNSIWSIWKQSTVEVCVCHLNMCIHDRNTQKKPCLWDMIVYSWALDFHDIGARSTSLHWNNTIYTGPDKVWTCYLWVFKWPKLIVYVTAPVERLNVW